ncbi:hypothetical protein [Gluconobacter frateurii]|uniref:Terminase n=1 Tax=Gluconobacter frateurii NRIC 0228 TaxID=1307946 RepID=A0ABQ0Q8T4_9PROT|nr:hypothetical protein [Gluconobacter frateurii]UMM09663.1 hypothetical protein MKW11_06340 [Gluconobacter frateurii]GBR09265.1 hypothetical protein AA0228_0623 [Gluconobacter frateurii NRIC 0228]GLP90805.1 hypothetical protein GCM10007868_18800 [Gluconobacter frateurii]
MNETQTDGLRGRSGRSRRRKERFLEHLAKSGNVSDSGRLAGVQRSTLYHWKETDAAFASQWEDALEDAADVLEAEARRRALEGYDEPITYAGKVVCDPETGHPLVRKKYSDGLMAFLLRAHRPSRFRAGQDEIPAAPISINISYDDSVL